VRRVVALVVAVLSLVAGAGPAVADDPPPPPPVEIAAVAVPGDLQVGGLGTITLVGFSAPMVVMSVDGGTPVSVWVDSGPVSNSDGTKTWDFHLWVAAHAGHHTVEISYTAVGSTTTAVDLEVDVPPRAMPPATVRLVNDITWAPPGADLYFIAKIQQVYELGYHAICPTAAIEYRPVGTATWHTATTFLTNAVGLGACDVGLLVESAGSTADYRLRLTAPDHAPGYTPSVRLPTTDPTPPMGWLKQMTLSPDLAGGSGGFQPGRGTIVGVDQTGSLVLLQVTGPSQPPLAIPVGPGWATLTVYGPGDWNGDGRNDLLARDTAGRLWLYPGNGHGRFGARVLVGNGWTGYRVVPAGDLNGDHRADLLAIDPKGDLWLYPGAGAGRFGKPVKVGNGWSGVQLYAAGDMTRDGRPDILGIDQAGKLWFYAGRGGGYFATRRQVGNGWGTYQFASGADLNGDGLGDLTGRAPDGKLWLYPGRIGGSFAQRVLLASQW